MKVNVINEALNTCFLNNFHETRCILIRQTPNFLEPFNNANKELAVRETLVEVCCGAVRELAKVNVLPVPNLENIFQVS